MIVGKPAKYWAVLKLTSLEAKLFMILTKPGIDAKTHPPHHTRHPIIYPQLLTRHMTSPASNFVKLVPQPPSSHHHLSPPPPRAPQPRTMDRETSRSPKAHLELQGPRPYVPRDVFDDATKSAIVGGLTGLFAAGVRNALSRENVGVSGMVTRQAPLIGILTVAPTVYSFVNGATQNLLGRNDAWGAVLGGFSAGCILGMPCKSPCRANWASVDD